MVEVIKDPVSWPEGISNGLNLECSYCKTVPKFDYNVDDEFWNEVVPKEYRLGVVCLPCLSVLAYPKKVGHRISRIQYTGIGETIVLEPTAIVQYS